MGYNAMLNPSDGSHAWAFMLLEGGSNIDFRATFTATGSEIPELIVQQKVNRGSWCAGTYSATEAGQLSLEWDNTGSLIYQKQVLLKTRCQFSATEKSESGDLKGNLESMNGWITKTWAC